MAIATLLSIVAMLAAGAVALYVFTDAHWLARDLERDLTQARGELASLRQAQDLSVDMQKVLDGLPIGVLLLAPDESVLMVNEYAGTLLRPDVAGEVQSLAELTEHGEVLSSVRQAIENHRAATGVVAPGPGRFVEVTAQPMDVGQTLVTLQDISELRHLRSVRRDFVANVSHELRTPLASIRLLVDTLEDGALEDADVAAGFIRRISVEADQLIQMVTELLELSRIESGQLPISREPVPLAELIDQVVERLQVVTQDKGVYVHTQIGDPPPVALADRGQIVQVLMNLLFNAVKFTPQGGEVRITARSHPRHVTVGVADTGVGIPREDLPRIFERFYKSDRARSRAGGGTGLGLPIARHIVESHGGAIWVESEEGAGSTFTFNLPSV